jgi:hypothetical protein
MPGLKAVGVSLLLACAAACSNSPQSNVHGGAGSGASGGVSGEPRGGMGGRASTFDAGNSGAPSAGGPGMSGNGGVAAAGGALTASGGDAPVAGGGRENGAGGVGVAGTAGARTCAAAFCEDFESGAFDAGKWAIATTGSNTARVQSDMSAHGKYAAVFHYAGTRNTWAMAHAKGLPASLRVHHFGRASLFFRTALPDRHAVLLTAGSAGFPSDKYLEVAAVASTFQLTFVDLNPGGGENYASGGTIPNGRWFCMQWEFNDTPDEAKVLVDGVQAFAVSPFTFNAKSSGLVGGFTDFGIGFRLWGSGAGDEPNDLFYDDLALDPEPLTCLE